MLALLVCAAGLRTAAAEAPESIEVAAMPEDTGSFVALRDQLADTPEGGAAIFVLAMMKFVENPELGEKFLTIALTRDNLKKSAKGYKGYRPGDSLQYHLNRLRKLEHLPGSYVVGSSPKDGYATQAPYRFEFSRNKYSEKGPRDIKVFVACSGAASPRPVRLKRNDQGVWKVFEASSLFVGVAAPVTDDGDDI
ncbi:MAG: hypothetical protein RIF32_20850 [Leptospirales bacterium]